MATTTVKGKIQSISAVTLVGEKKTALQNVILFVPGYHDGFEKKGRDQLWNLQIMGDKIAALGFSPAMIDKIIEARCYIDSQYVEPKEAGQDGFFSVNITVKDFEIAK